MQNSKEKEGIDFCCEFFTEIKQRLLQKQGLGIRLSGRL
jgi:hypothetical protein